MAGRRSSHKHQSAGDASVCEWTRILVWIAHYTEGSNQFADDPEDSTPSEQIGPKPSSYAEDNELGEPYSDMIDPAPFFIASFSGTDKDR